MALDPAGFIAALRLHEKLVLLTLSERYGWLTRLRFDSAVAGSMLVELHLSGRIQITGKRFALVSGDPLGSPALDKVVEEIFRSVQSDRKPRIRRWVGRILKQRPCEEVFEQFMEQGVLRQRKVRRLGMFSVMRYAFEDTTVEEELRRALRPHLLYGSSADSRTAALIGLVDATGLLEYIVSLRELPRIAQNVKAMVKQTGETIAAVRRAIFLYRFLPYISAASSLAGLLFGILRW